MKKVLIVLLSLFFVIGLVLTPFALEYFDIVTSKDNSDVIVEIEKGMSTKDIGILLKEKGCIKSEYTFYLRIKGSEYEGKLNYGKFNFRKNMSITEILNILANTHYVEETVKITFPEGYSIEQMAYLLEENGLVTVDEFFEALNDEYDYSFLTLIPELEYKYKLQGFLFPSTYEFYKETTAHTIIDKMLKTFENKYGELTNDFSNIFDIVVRASVIEKEAKLSNERYIISGVISNRLEKDMKLQIDACVLYQITDGMFNKPNLLFSDLEIDSLYNTYKNNGLPVGPICNPGLDSLKAALNPEQHDWLYYHTDENKKDGSHIFTKTFEEHKATMN